MEDLRNRIDEINKEKQSLEIEVLNRLQYNPSDADVINFAYWELELSIRELSWFTDLTNTNIQNMIKSKIVNTKCMMCGADLTLEMKMTDYKEYQKEISGLYPKAKPWEYIRLCESCREKQRKFW